jgi:A118 family predicted phage portal protein
MLYNLFPTLFAWIYEVLNKLLPKKEKGQLLPINLGLIVSPRMKLELTRWALAYIGYEPWLLKEDGITPNGMASLHIPALISSKLANATTIDMTIEITGSERADFLNDHMQKFLTNIRRYTEYASAKGGLLFKPYVTPDYQLATDYVQADTFYPMAFDSNSKIVGVCPVELKQISGNYFKRFEYHILEAEGEHVFNWAYKSEARDDLGEQCSLKEIPEWADLEEEAMNENAKQLLCGYFKMPFANNIDPFSPLGVSCFARALGTSGMSGGVIEETDRLWDAFCWEFSSGKRRLYVDQLAFGKDPRTGKPVLPPDSIYRTLNLGTMDDDFFKEWSPSLREMSYINALETHFRMIESQCGFSEGFLPRPAPLQVATATEIKMTKQDTYLTVSDTQKALRSAIEDYLYAADYLATAYNLAPQGDYKIEIGFDDSIVHDHDTEFQQHTQELGLRTMSRVEFRMIEHDETLETAKKMIAMADADAPVSSFFPQDENTNQGGF